MRTLAPTGKTGATVPMVRRHTMIDREKLALVIRAAPDLDAARDRLVDALVARGVTEASAIGTVQAICLLPEGGIQQLLDAVGQRDKALADLGMTPLELARRRVAGALVHLQCAPGDHLKGALHAARWLIADLDTYGRQEGATAVRRAIADLRAARVRGASRLREMFAPTA
jgi:hypothetical protein